MKGRYAVKVNACPKHPFSGCPVECPAFSPSRFLAHVQSWLSGWYKAARRDGDTIRAGALGDAVEIVKIAEGSL